MATFTPLRSVQLRQYGSSSSISSRQLIKSAEKRRRTSQLTSRVAAFGEPSTQQATISSASQLISIAILFGYALYQSLKKRSIDKDEPMLQAECPRCQGSGIEPCWCQRWSDGDAGCQSCNYSGMTSCRDCGGGGTAVPVANKVSDGQQY